MQPSEGTPEIRDQLLEVIGDEIRPAFERYRAVIVDELAPRARPDERPGLSHVPGGADAYARLARAHTSLDIAPEEVHAIGLEEIRRIDGEFVELGARLLGTKDLPAHARGAAQRSRPVLHDAGTRSRRWRRRRWRARTPPSATGSDGCRRRRARSSSSRRTRRSTRPSPTTATRPADGSRPGQFYINTYAPETRPRYEAETLAFHEAVPGHHLQLAICQELTDLPAFRRFNGSTAYIEGWGLYTERLSEEMGLLSGETDRFGVLSFDAWRAARLVVDTGIHALGWTRQQAIDFMAAHTALGLNNVANEVDRYIAYPGQALAYKLGQLELLRLRAEARERQGDRFDIRRFHDAVLGEGALPLPVLRQVVERALT